MKSLLQEASSVERAISQAWESAGSPQEFSVKIHDLGKRGFLGFSSKPAVVSITYKPLATHSSASPSTNPVVRGSQRSDSSRLESSESRRDDRRSAGRSSQPVRENRGLLADVEGERGAQISSRGERPERRRVGDRPERAERSERSDRLERPERKEFSRRGEKPSGEGFDVKPKGLLSYVEENDSNDFMKNDFDSGSRVSAKPVSADLKYERSNDFDADDNALGDNWEDSYVESVRVWLSELISIIGYAVSFNIRVVSKTLHIDFDADFVSDVELSRSLYASLSFMLLQFLKREHKRRFRGLRITLTHPGQDPFRFDSGS
jgi:predicted RNA-binding protein Jag